MPNRTLTTAQVLTMLTETPGRIALLTAGPALDWLHAKPDRDEWSANDVLAHLRACADVWGGCMQRLLVEQAPMLRAVNPRTWIKQTNYPEQPFHDSLCAFTRQRAELLAVLELLPPDGWLRTAAVTGAGAPLDRSVLFYGRWLAAHEQPHLSQIERLVATSHA